MIDLLMMVDRQSFPRKHMHRRAGFSRVDFLIVVLIAVVTSLLIMPAICKIREAANSMQCQNNLKQLALAARSHTSQGGLPPLTDLGDGAPTGAGIPSIFANLLPYIEAGPSYYDPKRSSPDAYYAHSSVVFTIEHKGRTLTETGGLANRTLRIFIDPSDVSAEGLRDIPMTLPDGTIGYYATGSYAANGLIAWGTRGESCAFQDGSASTILFTERPQLCRTTGGEDIYNLWGLGFYSPHMPAFAAITPVAHVGRESTGQVSPVEPLPEVTAGVADALVPVRIGRWDATPGPPDLRFPVQHLRGARVCDPRLPGSPHPFGMQAAMSDGSVRRFAANTSPAVFWAVCIPARKQTGVAIDP